MAHGGGDDIDKGRIDLVPMIDCIMLLLIFFVMTTKFTSEEKAISALLPTDKGQMTSTPQQKVDPPKTVNICLYPASSGMVKGRQPSDYAAELKRITNNGVITVFPEAFLRVGQRNEVTVEGKDLNSKGGKQEVMATVDMIHQVIKEELAKFEEAGIPRNKQPDIVIHCFSGLSWKFALVAYDAIRAYESAAPGGIKWTGDPKELEGARSVNFAPPRIRNYDANELGNELYEIIHMK
jgi:hypothetical protein